MRRRALLAAAAALAVAGCGDDEQGPAQRSAQDQVCDARAEIGRQVDALQEMTATTVTGDAVRGSLSAIRDGLRQIRDAQGELNDDRRAEIQAANDRFTASIRSVGATILRSTSVEEAGAQVRAAVDELGQAYRSTLAAVDC